MNSPFLPTEAVYECRVSADDAERPDASQSRDQVFGDAVSKEFLIGVLAKAFERQDGDGRPVLSKRGLGTNIGRRRGCERSRVDRQAVDP